MTICRHCGRGRVSRPRGLCWTCYYTPGVRELYPVTSKYGRRGVGNGYGKSKPATHPTNALPGSLEKVLVLSERAALGQDLWHVDDATMAGSRELARVG
jgi:hypothetical protein